MNNNALEKWLEKKDRLDAVPLKDTLESLGGIQSKRDKQKYSIPEVGYIIFKDQRWMNVHTNESGFGSTTLVKHVFNFENINQAMGWIVNQFPDAINNEPIQSLENNMEISGFRPPERKDEHLTDIKKYLIHERGIPDEIVNREINAGRIYATIANIKNEDSNEWEKDIRVVFTGQSSAELRSINPSGFKGCAAGSDTEKSGFQVMFSGNTCDTVAITEAAIDALSYNALYSDRFSISTNGAGRFHLQYRLALEAYRNGVKTKLAMDADHAGDLAAQFILNSFILREYLNKYYSIPKEKTDEYLLTNKINFTNNLTEPEELFASFQTQENDKLKIIFKVAKGVENLQVGINEIEVPLAAVKKIKKIYQVERDRPIIGKDWNETLKKINKSEFKSHLKNENISHSRFSRRQVKKNIN